MWVMTEITKHIESQLSAEAPIISNPYLSTNIATLYKFVGNPLEL